MWLSSPSVRPLQPPEQPPGGHWKWVNAIYSLHPIHKGTYSVDRLRALSRYCNQASPLRVAIVCFVLLAPALLIAGTHECIPLQDPADGWKANIGAWTRLGLIVFSCSIALIVQINAVVPLSKLTKANTIFVAVIVAGVYVFSQCVVASVWVYPIPLGYVWSVPIYSILLVIAFLLMIGFKTFRKHPTLGRQMHQQLGIILIETRCVAFILCSLLSTSE